MSSREAILCEGFLRPAPHRCLQESTNEALELVTLLAAHQPYFTNSLHTKATKSRSQGAIRRQRVLVHSGGRISRCGDGTFGEVRRTAPFTLPEACEMTAAFTFTASPDPPLPLLPTVSCTCPTEDRHRVGGVKLKWVGLGLKRVGCHDEMGGVREALRRVGGGVGSFTVGGA